MVQTGEIPFDNYFLPSYNQEHVSLTNESVAWLMEQLDGNYYNSLGMMQIVGASTICDQAGYSIENLPPNATVQWSLSNDNLIFGENSNKDNIFLKINGNGYCEIEARVSLPGSEQPLLYSKTVWAGAPRTYIKDVIGDINQIPEVPDPNAPDCCATIKVYPNHIVNIKFDADGLVGNTQWVADIPQSDICSVSNFGSYMTILGRKPGTITLSTKAVSDCGEGTFSFVVVDVIPKSGFNISPNPAYTTATIQLNEDLFAKNNQTSYEIQVWNATALIDTYQATEPTYQIPVSHLQAGIYFVHVLKDGEIYREKMIVK